MEAFRKISPLPPVPVAVVVIVTFEFTNAFSMSVFKMTELVPAVVKFGFPIAVVVAGVAEIVMSVGSSNQVPD
ncbi:MAG TPA: hypothetical protein DCE56_21755 [Cyanobacteria bacterium UBA8553]|nr:hypothetical protein [Cyanobacteria bacterium UBA8553]